MGILAQAGQVSPSLAGHLLGIVCVVLVVILGLSVLGRRK